MPKNYVESVQSTGSIASLAINPSGAVVYKIFHYIFRKLDTSSYLIGYPSLGLDKIAYVSSTINAQAQATSNIVWDSLNSRFLTIRGNGQAMHSTDGISWVTENMSTPGASPVFFGHIFTFNPSKIILFSVWNASSLPYESTDGINYTPLGSVTITSGVISSMKHPTTNRCVVYGEKIYYSDDLGLTWTQSNITSNGTIYDMIWSNYANKYIAVDSSNNFYTSTDAINWSLQATYTTLGLSNFQNTNTMFETSDGILVVAGYFTSSIKYTRDFSLSTPFLSYPTSSLPVGLISNFEGGRAQTIMGHYFPEGTNEKIKIFGNPNIIAVTL